MALSQLETALVHVPREASAGKIMNFNPFSCSQLAVWAVQPFYLCYKLLPVVLLCVLLKMRTVLLFSFCNHVLGSSSLNRVSLRLLSSMPALFLSWTTLSWSLIVDGSQRQMFLLLACSSAFRQDVGCMQLGVLKTLLVWLLCVKEYYFWVWRWERSCRAN